MVGMGEDKAAQRRTQSLHLGASDADELEELLPGGNMTAVYRQGDTVRRDAGPWTGTIHRLLEHLHAAGVDWLPLPLGTDAQGREVLTYIPGIVPAYPMPSWVWTEDVLVDAGQRMAALHAASADFDMTDSIWQVPAHEPVEVVCLNDAAPYNMVFAPDHRVCGWIDVDTASPGPRAWDLAYLAYRLIPLTSASDTGLDVLDLGRCRARLAKLCAVYASAGDRVTLDPVHVLEVAVARLVELAAFTAERAAAGANHVADHINQYRRDAAWIAQHLEVLQPLTR